MTQAMVVNWRDGPRLHLEKASELLPPRNPARSLLPELVESTLRLGLVPSSPVWFASSRSSQGESRDVKSMLKGALSGIREATALSESSNKKPDGEN
jgi:hypothetical protein